MTPRVRLAAMSGAVVGAALASTTLLGLPGRLAASLVAERLEAASHHRLRFAGETAVALWPSPSFTARDITFAEGTDPLKALRIEAQELKLSVDWRTLLTATPRLSQVALSRLHARMPLARQRHEAAGRAADPAFAAVMGWLAGGGFEHFVVSDGTMTLFDAGSGATSTLDHVDIAFSPALPGQLFTFDGEAVWNGQRVSLAARSAPQPPDTGPSEALPLDFLLAVPGTIPPVSGIARARFAEGALSFCDLKGLVGPHRFTGRLELDLSAAKPMIQGAFEADRLAFALPFDQAPTRLQAAVVRTLPAPPAIQGWSDRAVRLDRLNYVDAAFTFNLHRFGFGEMALSDVTLQARLQDGQAQVKLTAPSDAAPPDAASQGRATLAADLALDAAGAWPNYRLRLEAQVPKLQPFLQKLTGSAALDGRAALKLDVAAAGGSLRAVMASLEGAASVEVSGGRLDPDGLSPQLQPLAARLGTARARDARDWVGIDRLAARFRLDHGAAVTEDLHLASRWLDLDGRGTIDLSAGRLDLMLDPKVAARIATPAEAAAFGQPFAVQGAWRAPVLGPDLDGNRPAAEPRRRFDRPAEPGPLARSPSPTPPADRLGRPDALRRGALRLVGLAASAR